jgi:hypothetical protein
MKHASWFTLPVIVAAIFGLPGYLIERVSSPPGTVVASVNILGLILAGAYMIWAANNDSKSPGQSSQTDLA